MDRFPSDVLDRLACIYARLAVDAYLDEQRTKQSERVPVRPRQDGICGAPAVGRRPLERPSSRLVGK